MKRPMRMDGHNYNGFNCLCVLLAALLAAVCVPCVNAAEQGMIPAYVAVSGSTAPSEAALMKRAAMVVQDRVQDTLVPASEYIFVAIPDSIAKPAFMVNDLPNNDWTVTHMGLKDPTGERGYNVYRSNNRLTGTYRIQVTW